MPAPPTATVPGAPARTGARRRGRRFFAKVALANAIALFVVLAACEVGLRIWREGGVLAGLRSLVDDRPVPRELGTGDWLQADATRGYVLRAGVHGVDDLHVRRDVPARPPSPAGFRLLLLGDSVSWPADGFAALLQREGDEGPRRVDVVNAAVPGYTTWQESRHLDAILAPLEPAAVLLQYCCNDNHRFLHQLTDDGSLLITSEARRALWPEGDDWLTRVARWSYLCLEVRRALTAHAGARTDELWLDDPAFAAAWRDDSWGLVDDELGHMHELVRRRGVPFAVVAVPYGPQLTDAAQALPAERVRKPQLRLAEACARHGIPLLDLWPAFRAHAGEALFVDGIHLTALGHQLVAHELGPFLRAHGLWPPR